MWWPESSMVWGWGGNPTDTRQEVRWLWCGPTSAAADELMIPILFLLSPHFISSMLSHHLHLTNALNKYHRIMRLKLERVSWVMESNTLIYQMKKQRHREEVKWLTQGHITWKSMRWNWKSGHLDFRSSLLSTVPCCLVEFPIFEVKVFHPGRNRGSRHSLDMWVSSQTTVTLAF